MSKEIVYGRRYGHEFLKPTWDLIEEYNSKFPARHFLGMFDIRARY